MKDDCHVSSSIPLPSSIRRRAKRTLSRIKYLSQNHWSPFIQRSVSSSGRSSPRSYPSSVLSPSCASLSPPSSQNSVPERFLKPLTLSRPAPTIQVASLLADPQPRWVSFAAERDAQGLGDKISIRSYHLEIVQHPQRTAEFGHSSLSRLPITPPIIARLTVRDPSGNSVVPYVVGLSLLRYGYERDRFGIFTISREAELPFLIAHLSLFSEDGLTALNIGYETTLPILYGNLVSSIDQFEDTQGNLGLFFLFPDVSIRWRGRYQLRVTLARLSGWVKVRVTDRTLCFSFHVQCYLCWPQDRLTGSNTVSGAGHCVGRNKNEILWRFGIEPVHSRSYVDSCILIFLLRLTFPPSPLVRLTHRPLYRGRGWSTYSVDAMFHSTGC